MIITSLAVLYISFTCYFTGSSLFTKQTGGPWMACFTGLAFYGILFTAISVFFPVGTSAMQVLLLLVTGSLYLWKKPVTPRPGIKSIHPLIIACAITGILLLLLLNVSPINHPDTLVYHAQNIRWAAEHKAVPGVANLEYHLGLQSSQFILSALFSFRFTGSNALGFANISVLCWGLLFMLDKLNNQLRRKDGVSPAAFIPWVLLLIGYAWSFKMSRLSASSGSVDFITAIYCWTCLYLVAGGNGSKAVSPLQLALLTCFTISIKLSAVPLLPALLFYTWKSPVSARFKSGLVLLIPLMLLPILVRNSISSGYPLFPSALVGLPVDWKLPSGIVTLNENYIKAYARLAVEFERDLIETVAAAPAAGWMPGWWERLDMPDKTLLVLTVLLVLAALLTRLKNSSWPVRLVFFTSLAGTVAWFILAPDPRFGYGFIIPLAGSSIQLLGGKNRRTVPAFFPLAATMLVVLIFSGYLIHRSINYPVKNWWWKPTGIPAQALRETDCNGNRFYLPSTGLCADAPLPCVRECPDAVKRGPDLENGFRPAEHR